MINSMLNILELIFDYQLNFIRYINNFYFQISYWRIDGSWNKSYQRFLTGDGRHLPAPVGIYRHLSASTGTCPVMTGPSCSMTFLIRKFFFKISYLFKIFNTKWVSITPLKFRMVIWAEYSVPINADRCRCRCRW